MQLKGKPVSDRIKAEIMEAVEECKAQGKDLPKLAILRVGKRPDDIAYESRVLKNCQALGISAEVFETREDVSMEEFLILLQALNDDVKTHGILVFRPLPPQLDGDVVAAKINPIKDIDCMSPVNAEKIFSGDSSGIPPCTPEAVIEILKHYGFDLSGKNVAIVNRSMVLGKPLSMLFLKENSTVTICHSKTKELPKVTAGAEIVVTGAGRANFFGPEYFNPKSVVVDVGINLDESGGLCGDVDFSKVSEGVAAITPVPGGVGTVTSMLLLKHVIQAMKTAESVVVGKL